MNAKAIMESPDGNTKNNFNLKFVKHGSKIIKGTKRKLPY